MGQKGPRGRVGKGVPTGGQFAASAKAESEIFLDKEPGSMAYRSVDEDHEFFGALAMRETIDTASDAAIEAWQAAAFNVRWWRPGSKTRAAKARGAAVMATSSKGLNDSIIRGYTARHGMPDFAQRFLDEESATTPGTEVAGIASRPAHEWPDDPTPKARTEAASRPAHEWPEGS